MSKSDNLANGALTSVCVVLALAINVTMIYIVLHFISKYW